MLSWVLGGLFGLGVSCRRGLGVRVFGFGGWGSGFIARHSVRERFWKSLIAIPSAPISGPS